MTREAGLNGIVNILQAEDTRMMQGKSRDGWLFVAQEDVGEILSTWKSTAWVAGLNLVKMWAEEYNNLFYIGHMLSTKQIISYG